MFRKRGLNVFASDSQRRPQQIAIDAAMALCLILWSYETSVNVWPALRPPLWPEWLQKTLFSTPFSELAGALLIVTALFVYAVALRDLGLSWRLGIDRNAPGPLVTRGIYAWSRHPIYAAFDLIFLGSFLLQGTFAFLLLTLAIIPLLHAIMLREERFLLSALGEQYQHYKIRVPRYF